MLKGKSLQELAALMAPEDIFSVTYSALKKLEFAEKQNDVAALQKMSFGVAPTCIRCSKPCIDMTTGQYTPKQCGKCQAVIYCGRACQLADWKTPLVPQMPPHKTLCAKNAEHMKRLPFFTDTIESFPWGRVESDGTTSHDLLAARFGVLGSEMELFGYWAVPGGLRPHDDSTEKIAIPSPGYAGRVAKVVQGKYLHGKVLLTQKWPTDTEAWKLKNESLIPRLFFTDDNPAPRQHEPGQVTDWHSWYKWRRLDLASPAAVLMNYPLSVYHLLVHILKVVDPHSSPAKRQRLLVHYIGAEVELNFLPLFSELALLLPNTDIRMVIPGKAGCNLVHRARRDHPGSLATSNVVWSYTAPKNVGASSIAVQIYSRDELWTRAALDVDDLPDALVALNAGLFAMGIPFGVTDYAEQSLMTAADFLPTMRRDLSSQTDYGSRAYNNLLKPQAYTIAPNPFHRPGKPGIGVVRMPNHCNGFTMAL